MPSTPPQVKTVIFDVNSRAHGKLLEYISDSLEYIIDHVEHPLFTIDAQKALRSFVRTMTSLIGVNEHVRGIGVTGLYLDFDTSRTDELTVSFHEWFNGIAFVDAPIPGYPEKVPMGEKFATVKIRELTTEERMAQGVLKTPVESMFATFEDFKQRWARKLELPLPWIMDAPMWLLAKFNDPILEHTSSMVEARITSVVEDDSDPTSPKLTIVSRYPEHELVLNLDFRKGAEPCQRMFNRITTAQVDTIGKRSH